MQVVVNKKEKNSPDFACNLGSVASFAPDYAVEEGLAGAVNLHQYPKAAPGPPVVEASSVVCWSSTISNLVNTSLSMAMVKKLTIFTNDTHYKTVQLHPQSYS